MITEDIEDDVDDIVDDMDPLRIDRLLDKHEIELDELLRRVKNELKARLA